MDVNESPQNSQNPEFTENDGKVEIPLNRISFSFDPVMDSGNSSDNIIRSR